MASRIEWDLKGPVRVCKTEAPHLVVTVEFREDGLPIRTCHRSGNGQECTGIYEYRAGQLISLVYHHSAGMTQRSSFEYDAMGRLTKVMHFGPKGARLSETYEYDDPAGRQKKIFYVDTESLGQGGGVSFGFKGTNSNYNCAGAATLTTFHNERAQPTEAEFHDFAGKRLSRIIFNYDANGHLIEELQIVESNPIPPPVLAEMDPAQVGELQALFDDGRFGSRRSYRYDEKGRRVEDRSEMGLALGSIDAWVYNDQGDVIGSITDDQQAGRSESRTHYEYDSHGNWLIKKLESRAGLEGELSVSHVEKRTLEYF